MASTFFFSYNNGRKEKEERERMDMALLEVRHLKKTYTNRFGTNQVQALRDVSFTISGKTTLLNLLASFDRPTGGEIILNGLSFQNIREKDLASYRRKNLGFVFQDFNLLDTLSVKDNIFLPLVLAGAKPEEMKKRVMPLAKVLRIDDLMEKFPYEISGGQKQRTAIARALITEPRLVLADEPTGALDSRASNELLNMFEQINRAGQTILMVTHSTKAASHAGRVLFIKDGIVYHQIYRGDKSRDEMFKSISETLTVMASGGKTHA